METLNISKEKFIEQFPSTEAFEELKEIATENIPRNYQIDTSTTLSLKQVQENIQFFHSDFNGFNRIWSFNRKILILVMIN